MVFDQCGIDRLRQFPVEVGLKTQPVLDFRVKKRDFEHSRQKVNFIILYSVILI